MGNAKSPKLTGALKKFIDAGKPGSRVISSVERFYIAHPAPSDRRTDVLHPSAMVKSDWCYRGSYFQLLGFPAPPSKYRASLRQKRVFKLGHDIHNGWQDIFKEMGNLYGKWECMECGDFFWGLPDCHDGPLEYREVALYYEPLRISGHSDGILLNFGEPLMLEIKSVGAGTFRFEAPQIMYENDGEIEKMWKALDAPFMTHIMQVQLYMKLAELLKMEYQPQEALLLYENKSSQEPKEWVIAKSDFGITPILEAAEMIVKAVDMKTPPTCNINPVEGCYQCKEYENV